MAEILRIIVATNGEASRQLIKRVVGQDPAARLVAEVDSDAALLDAVNYRRPQLVFISTDLSDLHGFAAAARLSRQFPGLYMVMVSPRVNDVDDLRQAMKAGARECLFEPLAETDIVRILHDVREIGRTIDEKRGAIIAVTSSKGGVGKSTLAVSLAVALKQLSAGRVALADADLYFGDIATLLNIKPDRTVYDLNQALDAEVADRFLYKHETGVEVLPAPARVEQAEEIAPERFRSILQVLQTLYDTVVVDVTVSAFDTMLTTFDVADLVVLVTTLDVPCLKDIGQMLVMLDKIRFPHQHVMLVGNRQGRVSLDPKDAERAVGMSFAAILPEDDRVTGAANRGVPAISAEPGVPFTQKLRALAKIAAERTGRIDRVSA